MRVAPIRLPAVVVIAGRGVTVSSTVWTGTRLVVVGLSMMLIGFSFQLPQVSVHHGGRLWSRKSSAPEAFVAALAWSGGRRPGRHASRRAPRVRPAGSLRRAGRGRVTGRGWAARGVAIPGGDFGPCRKENCSSAQRAASRVGFGLDGPVRAKGGGDVGTRGFVGDDDRGGHRDPGDI